MGYRDRVDFAAMKGARVTDVERDGDEELRFVTNHGTYRMFHDQDCCESVSLAEVVGDLNDIRGELLEAEMVTSDNKTPEGVAPPKYPDSYTWTFYKLGTAKGCVVLRWLGESNGYYSENVDLELLPNEAIDASFSVVDRKLLGGGQ